MSCALPHTDDELLERFLDRDLAPAERADIEAHLAGCAACRDTLARLAALYEAFDALPAAPLPIDLAPRVLARIAPRVGDRGGWLIAATLVAQVALTLALVAWLAPALSWSALDPALPSPLRRVASLTDLLPPVLSLSSIAWAFAASALVGAWLAGNRLALVGVAAPMRRAKGA